MCTRRCASCARRVHRSRPVPPALTRSLLCIGRCHSVHVGGINIVHPFSSVRRYHQTAGYRGTSNQQGTPTLSTKYILRASTTWHLRGRLHFSWHGTRIVLSSSSLMDLRTTSHSCEYSALGTYVGSCSYQWRCRSHSYSTLRYSSVYVPLRSTVRRCSTVR